MLPKIEQRRFKHTLYGLDKEIEYRAFTVREQKMLLEAKQADNSKDKIESVKQIIDNCTFGLLNVDELAVFDIEDIFLRIRSRSAGEQVKIAYSYIYEGTKEKIVVNINLDDIVVKVVEGHSNDIKISDNLFLKMKYPTFETMTIGGNEDEQIINAIDFVYTGDEVYYLKDIPSQERIEYIKDFSVDTLLEIKKFFKTMPTVRYETKVTLKDGKEESLEFAGLNDFFRYV